MKRFAVFAVLLCGASLVESDRNHDLTYKLKIGQPGTQSLFEHLFETLFQDICSLPSVPGPCRGSFPHYYYSMETDTCQLFDDGGCQGNGNSFDTAVQCEQRCKKTQEAVVQPDYRPSEEEYNRQRLEQEEAYRVRAEERRQEAERRRQQEEQYPQIDERRNAETNISNVIQQNDICSLDFDVGPCRALIPSFYYNARSRTCQAFIYGGCQGNANRFETEELCERQCGLFRGVGVKSTPNLLLSTRRLQKTDYFVSMNPTTFAVAASDCRTIFGDHATLLSLETKEEFEFVVNEVLASTDSSASRFWTNGMYDGTEGMWKWANGVKIGAWAPWRSGYPSSKAISQLRTILFYENKQSSKWETQQATIMARYICENQPHVHQNNHGLKMVNWAWNEGQGHLDHQNVHDGFQVSDYFVSVNPVTLSNHNGAAVEDCRSLYGKHGDLLSIETPEEYEFIVEHVLGNSDSAASDYWTSGTYRRWRRNWYWSSNVKIGSWVKWGPGSPSKKRQSKEAVVLHFENLFTNHLDTRRVSHSYRYICENNDKKARTRV